MFRRVYTYIIMSAVIALTAHAAGPARLITSDSLLAASYEKALTTALGYAHNGSDPVGLWYEAALPGRDAFCMRDLSHQAVAACILGLEAHTANMLEKVASNISESKDWCSYWEIDRLDRPAPCDYANDKEFWYNLPANFDVMRACRDVAEWTGDGRYVSDETFRNFYKRNAHDYVERWKLNPDSIMSRERFMNYPEPFDRKNGFHTCRGLPSYAESFSGITVAIDLLGALKCGYEAYSQLCDLAGLCDEAEFGRKNAARYNDIIENQWWDKDNSRYNTYYTADGSFHRGEGLPFMLLTGALDNQDRIRATVEDVLKGKWNVENLSAFPVFLYRYGYRDEGRKILTELMDMKRSDYPEVSFGVIDGIFRGLMGIDVSASAESITTQFGGRNDETMTAEDVPALGGTVTVRHDGTKSSTLTNRAGLELQWTAKFADGRTKTAKVKPGKTKTLKCR